MTPLYSSVDSLGTPNGTWIKPGGRVAAYVRSTGLQEGDDLFAMSGNLVTSLNEGCKRCRSGMNDIVYVLPGHTENLSTADAIPDLVAGTQIVSCGDIGATNNPKLTWTAAGATFLLNVANVRIIGMTLDFAGADDVVAPITVTGAGCAILGCQLKMADGTFGCLQGVLVSTGASGFKFCGNTALTVGETDPTTTGGVVSVGAAVDDVLIEGNYMSAATPGDTVGIIDVTAAATNLRIRRNTLIQLETTNAAFAIIVDNVAATGEVSYNLMKLGEDNPADDCGLSLGAGAAATLLAAENYVVDNVNSSAILSPDVTAGVTD